MRDTETETFKTTSGAVEISLVKIPGRAAGVLVIDLLKQHGPAISKLMVAMDDPSKIGDAIGALTSGLSGADFDTLLGKLIKGGRVNTGEEFQDLDLKTLDILFAGHTGELFKLVWFGLRFNYSSFFVDFAALIPKQKTAIPSKSSAANG